MMNNFVWMLNSFFCFYIRSGFINRSVPIKNHLGINNFDKYILWSCEKLSWQIVANKKVSVVKDYLICFKLALVSVVIVIGDVVLQGSWQVIWHSWQTHMRNIVGGLVTASAKTFTSGYHYILLMLPLGLNPFWLWVLWLSKSGCWESYRKKKCYSVRNESHTVPICGKLMQ